MTHMSSSYEHKVGSFFGLIFALLITYFLWSLAGQPGLINLADGGWISQSMGTSGNDILSLFGL